VDWICATPTGIFFLTFLRPLLARFGFAIVVSYRVN